MQHWIGTSGFQYPEWKGTFYPEKMPADQMLPYYAEHFATTEINYSFRRIPNRKTIDKWAAATPARFKFAFKAPQKVTHFAKLRNCSDTLEYFASVLTLLKEKLAPVLFQLPPNLKKDVPLLESFLASMPYAFRGAFEFRDPSWFDDAVYGALKTHNAALCIADSETLTTPTIATADFGYLRLRREDYTTEDLSRWANFIRQKQADWGDAFIYLKHEEAGIGPKFAKHLIGELDSAAAT